MEVSVFLDTNVLLKGFAAFHNGQNLPEYIIDNSVKKFTFEKCIYESYMAFRGVGGKKPDEGRGRWAESNLNQKTDPLSIGKLASQIHNGNTEQAFFWTNQILEASATHLVNEEQALQFLALDRC